MQDHGFSYPSVRFKANILLQLPPLHKTSATTAAQSVSTGARFTITQLLSPPFSVIYSSA